MKQQKWETVPYIYHKTTRGQWHKLRACCKVIYIKLLFHIQSTPTVPQQSNIGSPAGSQLDLETLLCGLFTFSNRLGEGKKNKAFMFYGSPSPSFVTPLMLACEHPSTLFVNGWAFDLKKQEKQKNDPMYFTFKGSHCPKSDCGSLHFQFINSNNPFISLNNTHIYL